MNIKEFLLDNYIWLLVVILLTIITIIGFLADKKKNKAEKSSANGMAPNQGGMNTANMGQIPITYNNQNTMNQQNMTYQPPVNNVVAPQQNNMMGVNPMPQEPTPVPEPMPSTVSIPNPMPINQNVIMNNNMNQMEPVSEPMPVPSVPISTESPVAPEPVAPQPLNYQPLGEQKPVIAPRSPEELIKDFQNNNNGIVSPSPVEPVVAPTPVPVPVEPIVNNSINQTQMMPGPMPQGVAMPQPIPNPEQMMPQSGTIPSPIPTPSPVNPQPINFVYGQQNGNQ